MEVRADDGTIIVLDCGTGIRELGLSLTREETRPKRIFVLIGHTHWDHIQGFPFFTPAFFPEMELNIFAPSGFQRSLEDSLSGQMQYSYFPVKLQDLTSRIHFTELEEGFLRLGDALVETQYLNHTAPTIAYRITSGGSSLVYVTDHEPFWHAPGPVFHHPGDQRHIEFLRGADLVIHDAQYTTAEYRTKVGWGHSTVEYATDVAVAAGVSRLALFHHDPEHDDPTVLKLEEGARQRAAEAGSPVEIFAAAEGLTVELESVRSSSAVQAESALKRRRIFGGRVLVVTDALADIAAIEQTLAEDSLRVYSAGNGQAALQRIAEMAPDLVILNSQLTDGPGVSFIQPIRARLSAPELPILILTSDAESIAQRGGEGVITDYLTRPFNPPMLRTRVRAWLARTMTPSEEVPTPATPGAPAIRSASPTAQRVMSAAETLGATLLFRPLAKDQTDKLAACASQRSYPAGQVIIREGEHGNAVFVIVSGRVRIVETLVDSSVDMFLGELGAGEAFGELGILRASPRAASIIAMERTTCLVIPERDFVDVLETSPAMAMGLLRILAGRIYETDRLLARYAPDPLTGLPGRRAFNEFYERLAAGARRRRAGVLLLYIDVMRLSEINDSFGYSVGDELLRTVGDALLDSSRSSDLVARYGSDEFAVLLVDAGAKHAETLIERVQRKVQRMASERGLPMTAQCRFGYAVSATPPPTAGELLLAADRDMQNKRLALGARL
ncbi:MAG TPA: diguanylate cyclase [Terriglobia bacterium]|nr:diguanylate cyclase [Terriglobia bacterium]